METDPLFDAITEQRAPTWDEVNKALRWRMAHQFRLKREIEVLSVLQDRLYEAAEIRAERDPPLETAERTRH